MTKRNRQGRRKGGLAFALLLCVFALVMALAFPRLYRMGQELRNPLRYEAYIYRYSAEFGLDPYLVMGVIRAESSFRPDVVSPTGARGLMQIMPATGADQAERKGIAYHDDYLFDPAYNIRMGTYYLARLLDMFPVQDTALAAYNAGMGNVFNWLSDSAYSDDGVSLHTIPFAETRYYVVRVNQYMAIYRELYGR